MTETADAKTLGQIAFEAQRDFLEGVRPWSDVREPEREVWEATAAAVAAADREKLRTRLAEALDSFYLTIRARGNVEVHGQVSDPEEVADALHATLSRIAAEEKP